ENEIANQLWQFGSRGIRRNGCPGPVCSGLWTRKEADFSCAIARLANQRMRILFGYALERLDCGRGESAKAVFAARVARMPILLGSRARGPGMDRGGYAG